MPPPPAQMLDKLTGLFYPLQADLGAFALQAGGSLPPVYSELLDHEHHMTVTVEAFHCSPVDVRVLRKNLSGDRYARLILLARQSDRQVVQFGIMRVKLDLLAEDVRREIEAEQTPLGRILIQHDVLRTIHLCSLWQVAPGAELCRLFGLDAPQTTYGRTAVIDCNEEPAIELLEIVTPHAGVLQ